MPILERETSCHPETLLDDPPVEPERNWLALYTKARQEKALARDLLVHNVAFYLPLIPQMRVYRRRRTVTHNPLFSGYMFVLADEEERWRCLATNRVSHVVKVANQEELYRDLQQVERLIASGAPLTVESRLFPGRRVRVRQGPLYGLEGTIVARQGQCRLIVAVKFLRQGVSLEIDDYLVEPA